MHKYERAGLWVAVAAIGVFTLFNYAAIDNVEEVAADYTARLDMPVVRADVIAGVPEGLREPWQKAIEAAEIDPDATLWLTVPVTNRGYAPAGEVTARLAFVPEIKGVYAYSSEGDTFAENWGGPEIAEGGAGENAVSVEFDEDLPRGASHLMFVSLAPADFGPAPYDDADAQEWAALNPTYWRKVEVTAAEDAWTDDELTTVLYGAGSASAPVTAEATPAAPAAEPAPGAAAPDAAAPAATTPG